MPKKLTENYHAQRDIKNIEKLNRLLAELPEFCREFFIGIESTKSVLTRLAYAYDLRVFFEYLIQNNHKYMGRGVPEITLNDMETISPTELEAFLSYLSLYEKDDAAHTNANAAKARKLSTLRSFFKYYFKKEKLSRNVAAIVDQPKIHEKPIVHLEVNEVADLLDAVENGDMLTKKQKQYHAATHARDIALLTLFLSTGIRVSELVGLSLTDVDLDARAFRVTRKGGNQVVLYFNEETENALRAYYNERMTIEPETGHEQALFLSMQKKRMSARSVQLLVQKYTRAVTPLKHITPHKLRSTYGTMLYQETGDIYLVADVLGHSDVNTTRKHYAAQQEENRRQAARSIKLREDD